MFKRFGSIYKITNLLNQKVYIGQTTKTIEERWNGHKTNPGCKKLHRAIKKYGSENFKIEEIYVSFDLENLNKIEELLINKFKSIENGYNLRLGGKYSPQSEETKKKISISLKNVPLSKKKIPNNKGRIHSKESKLNMGLGLKGKHLSEEHKRKISDSHKGKSFSSETREKLSISHKNNLNKKRSKIKCLNNNVIYESILKASKELNLRASSIHHVLKGKYSQTRGYKFIYVN